VDNLFKNCLDRADAILSNSFKKMEEIDEQIKILEKRLKGIPVNNFRYDIDEYIELYWEGDRLYYTDGVDLDKPLIKCPTNIIFECRNFIPKFFNAILNEVEKTMEGQ